MAEFRDQANQDPTPTRIRQARERGQFPQSRELAAAISWLGGIAILATLGNQLWQSMRLMSISNWQTTDIGAEPLRLAGEQFTSGATIFWQSLLPVLGSIALIVLVAHMFQTEFRLFPGLLAPKLERLSPQTNVRRLISLDSLVPILIGLTKLLVLSGMAIWILSNDFVRLIEFTASGTEQGIHSLSQYVFNLLIKLVAASCVVGLVDYGIKWCLNRRRLRMTEQEVRDERRSSEPSPEISAHRRLSNQRN